VLRELAERLAQERTHQREEQYHTMMTKVKESLPLRAQFQINDIESIRDKWFIEPGIGEENMVGALYTLFSHLVPRGNPIGAFWSRPLTFSAYGIDAIASTDEVNLKDSLQYLEYKHTFSPDIEFNHPFSITNEIICWDFRSSTAGTTVEDSFDYVSRIGASITAPNSETQLGFWLEDIRMKSGLQAMGHKIRVLSLKRLLGTTFQLHERAATAAVTR
jgi:hypothetical protein